jgi:hypothetical protein
MSGSVCHYCGDQQPKRKLRRLELSTAGEVVVCRDTERCHRQARARLYTAPSVATASAGGSVRRQRGKPVHLALVDGGGRGRRRRSLRGWTMWTSVLLIGLLVLPHFTIHGHHWRFWLFP